MKRSVDFEKPSRLGKILITSSIMNRFQSFLHRWKAELACFPKRHEPLDFIHPMACNRPHNNIEVLIFQENHCFLAVRCVQWRCGHHRIDEKQKFMPLHGVLESYRDLLSNDVKNFENGSANLQPSSDY